MDDGRCPFHLTKIIKPKAPMTGGGCGGGGGAVGEVPAYTPVPSMAQQLLLHQPHLDTLERKLDGIGRQIDELKIILIQLVNAGNPRPKRRLPTAAEVLAEEEEEELMRELKRE